MSVGIFQTPDGSLHRSRWSNRVEFRTSEIFWLSCLPARIKSRDTGVLTSEYNANFRHFRAANSTVNGGIWPKYSFFQACKVALYTCKNKKDPIKTVITTFLWVCFSAVQGRPTPQSMVKSGRNCMIVLLTCRNKEAPINQRTNGPVNAHLISGPSISEKHTKPG